MTFINDHYEPEETGRKGMAEKEDAVVDMIAADKVELAQEMALAQEKVEMPLTGAKREDQAPLLTREKEPKLPVVEAQVEEIKDFKFEIDDGALEQLLMQKGGEALKKEGQSPKQPQELSPVEYASQVFLGARENIKAMENELAGLVDALDNHRSILDSWANSWGKMHWFTKLTSGVVIVSPPVIGGLIASIPGLVAVGLTGATAFTSVGFLLQNHHDTTQDKITMTSQVVQRLVGVFSCMIEAFGKLMLRLSEEITKLAEENIKLAANVDRLEENIESMTSELDRFVSSNIKLEKTSGEFEGISSKFQGLVRGLELHRKEVTASEEVLRATIEVLAGKQLTEADAREELNRRLTKFIEDKDATFERLAGRVLSSEDALDRANEQLEQAAAEHQKQIEKYEQLHSKFEVCIGQLQAVMGHEAVQHMLAEVLQQKQQQAQHAKAMGQFGFLQPYMSERSDVKHESSRDVAIPAI